MKWFVLIFMLALVSVSYAVNENVASEFDIPSYEANKSINLTATCINQGVACNGNVECNASVFYPNMSVMIENRTMGLITNGIVNITIEVNETNVVGTFRGFASCNDLSSSGIVGGTDLSFRIVDTLLYHGGGIQTFDIAISLGLVMAALVLGLISVLSKSIWLRSITLFAALITLITQGDVLLKVANINSQSGLAGTLEGYYLAIVFFSIVVLGLFIVNFIWDLAESLGKSPQTKLGFKKKETLEE